jgi:hypothetical protein
MSFFLSSFRSSILFSSLFFTSFFLCMVLFLYSLFSLLLYFCCLIFHSCAIKRCLNQFHSVQCVSVCLLSPVCFRICRPYVRNRGTRCLLGRGRGLNGLPLKDNESLRVRMSNDEIICSNGGHLAFVLVSPHKRNANCSPPHLHFTKSHIRDSHFD